MDLDDAIRMTFSDFNLKVHGLILNPVVGGAFCRVVVRLHGATVAPEVVLTRLMDLSDRKLLRTHRRTQRRPDDRDVD